MKLSYLAPEVGFAETSVEVDSVVTLDKTNTQSRRDKVLGITFHVFLHVISVNDSLYMLGNRCVRA